MLGALLEGDNLQGVVELAAAEVGAPVAILIPARGLAAASHETVDLSALAKHLAARPDSGGLEGVECEVPVLAGKERIGWALALAGARNGLPRVEVDRVEVLRTAAMASLTVLAVTDARDEMAGKLRGTLLEELRARKVDGVEVARRAARMGCDLSAGAVALVAEAPSARPRHAAALITGEYPGAIAEPLDVPGATDEGIVRIYALLPARTGDDPSGSTLSLARRISERLRPLGPSAFSSFCPSPDELDRAVAEAELMLDVIGRDQRMASQLGGGVGDGVYRLLFRAMASDPQEVHRFYSDTVEPLVAHDREYRTDLLGTLEAYLGNDCNMNATARAVYAHRHTVAHRLARIRELCDLDPAAGEDRERLGLGIKAFRIIEPTLPR
ncbi:MAG: helix-turn-helix domain-containing protein [Actinomycetota bacterium]|nr:helix-turn-helix domain-containing protein [Actinomycetota bacterium]